MRIIIIRFSALGDVILATSIVELLREEFPQAEIDFITKPAFSDVISSNQNVSKVFLYNNKNQFENTQTYDLLVDLQSNLKSFLLRRKIQAKQKVVYNKTYLNRLLLVWFKINRFKDVQPIPLRYANSLKIAGILPRYAQPQIGFQLPKFKPAQKYICIAIGAKWFTKRWPLSYFKELIRLIHLEFKSYQIYLIGSDSEKDEAKELIHFTRQKLKKKNIKNLCGDLSILESAAIIRKAKLLISNDSALVHVATAFNVSLIALFLSTVPEFGFTPPLKNATTLSLPMSCKPCNHKGLAQCPKGHFKCANELSAPIVFSVVREKLKNLET